MEAKLAVVVTESFLLSSLFVLWKVNFCPEAAIVISGGKSFDKYHPVHTFQIFLALSLVLNLQAAHLVIAPAGLPHTGYLELLVSKILC